MFEQIEIECPHCWEINTIEISDIEGKRQEFMTDCAVCCNPMEIKVTIDRIDGEPAISVTADRANT